MLDAETQSASSAQADLDCRSNIALTKHCLVQLPHSDANHKAEFCLERSANFSMSVRPRPIFRILPSSNSDSDSATHPSFELCSARIKLSDPSQPSSDKQNCQEHLLPPVELSSRMIFAMLKFLIIAFQNTAVGFLCSVAGVVLQPCRPSVSANTNNVLQPQLHKTFGDLKHLMHRIRSLG